jgi:hypothetical protein
MGAICSRGLTKTIFAKAMMEKKPLMQIAATNPA